MSGIGHLGTFDVENYGDLLYPLVFRHVLQRRDATLSVHQYSLLPGVGPQQAGFATQPVRSLFEPGRDGPCRLVVGGGDILRTDWDLVARHYGRASRVRFAGLRRSIGTTHVLGYLLRENLPRLDAGRFYARRFRARWMNYPAAGPFLINPDELPQGRSVCYLSCGVPHDFTPAERDGVRRTFEKARFVYLRDEQSAEKLRRTGLRCELHVAPDLAVILSDPFEHVTEARRGREILSRLGVDIARSVLCFQSMPYPGFSEEGILRQLKHYRERTRAEVVLLPVGNCHGDHELLQRLWGKSGGAFKYASDPSIFDIISIIAASDAFVGTSLHGNVTAFSYGIPHLFGPLAVAKAEGFLTAVGLPPELKLVSWGELNDKLDMAMGLGGAFFSSRAREAKLRVYRVVDELLDNLLK